MPSDQSSDASKPEPKCILVVDDVSTIRLIAGSVFKHAGHQVIEARNGPEALMLTAEHLPDLIVLDLMMEGAAEGISLIDDLRQESALSDIPIVVLTGKTDPETLRQISERGVRDFIVKDNLENVTQRLKEHLKHLEEKA